jgi:Domain of unknown function (DUF4919)
VTRLVAALIVLAALVLPAAASDDRAYEDLLAKLKAGDTAIDFQALRLAYAESASYDPYGSGPKNARVDMIKAFNKGDCEAALAHANAIIEEVYIDAEAHIVASRCLGTALGKAAFHREIAQGLGNSILDSGDGKSAATAFVIVRIAEEYYVLGAMGLRMQGQSLASEGGHAFDLMKATDRNGNAVSVYFQIDRVLAAADRNFSTR